jgi:hypothetical protein
VGVVLKTRKPLVPVYHPSTTSSKPSINCVTPSHLNPKSTVWFFLIMTCILTGEPEATDSLLWRTVRGNTWFFLWLPFWYRFCTGFVHFLMSLPILPGPVLYHEGPLLKTFPASVMEMVSESYMMRQMNR